VTDLETELLNRVIDLSTKLAREQEFRENNEYVYSDQEELITEMNDMLKSCQVVLERVKETVDVEGLEEVLVRFREQGLPLNR
jgi:uncharacterized coiled-coil protein SlyX